MHACLQSHCTLTHASTRGMSIYGIVSQQLVLDTASLSSLICTCTPPSPGWYHTNSGLLVLGMSSFVLTSYVWEFFSVKWRFISTTATMSTTMAIVTMYSTAMKMAATSPGVAVEAPSPVPKPTSEVGVGMELLVMTWVWVERVPTPLEGLVEGTGSLGVIGASAMVQWMSVHHEDRPAHLACMSLYRVYHRMHTSRAGDILCVHAHVCMCVCVCVHGVCVCVCAPSTHCISEF